MFDASSLSLPKYRGGTPLQNQIINDDLDSAVTIFKMTSVMDAGPICSQEYLSLRGDLSVIFSESCQLEPE